MARVPTPGGFRQPSLRPVAQPVDTYFQGKLVKPAEAVDNNVLQLTKGFAALSSSLVKYQQDQEEQLRKLMPKEAAGAIESFGGTFDDLRGVALMDNKQATAWLKENQELFKIPLTHADRPDFLLQLKSFAGRRWTKEVGYSAKIYSPKVWERLSDPDHDPQEVLKELREELLEDIDPDKGHHFIMGALAQMAYTENQVISQLHATRQKIATQRLMESFQQTSRDSIIEVLFHDFFRGTPYHQPSTLEP